MRQKYSGQRKFVVFLAAVMLILSSFSASAIVAIGVVTPTPTPGYPPLSLETFCSTNGVSADFTVTGAAAPDLHVDISNHANFTGTVYSGWALDPGTFTLSLSYTLSVFSDGLWVRWAGDHDITAWAPNQEECSTPTPTPTPTYAPSGPQLSCGQVTWSNIRNDWAVAIGSGLYGVADMPVFLPAGLYHYEWFDISGEVNVDTKIGGEFTIEACPTPTPTPTPTCTPVLRDAQPLAIVVNPCPTETPTSPPMETPTPTPTATPTAAPSEWVCPPGWQPGQTWAEGCVPVPTPTVIPSVTPKASPSGMPNTTTGGPGSGGDGALPLVFFGLALLIGSFSYAVGRRLGFLNPRV